MRQFLEGNWRQIKHRLKQKYDQLTEKDLEYTDGNEGELICRLQRKLDLAEDELIIEFKNLITNNGH